MDLPDDLSPLPSDHDETLAEEERVRERLLEALEGVEL